MRTLLLLLIFVCKTKRPKYADTAGGSKTGQVLRTSLMDQDGP